MNKSDYLAKPFVWADEITETYPVEAQYIVPGDLIMFTGIGAYEVQSIDLVSACSGLDDDLLRFNCNNGATMVEYGTNEVQTV